MEVAGDAFATSVLAWHDFFVAVAEATAALLGLLFVAVSIRIAASPNAQRAEERARAATVFGNLVAAMVLSLIVLIPRQDARSVALQIGLVAGLSLVRVIRRSWELLAARPRWRQSLTSTRRMAWTAFAVAMLLYAAIGLWTSGDAAYLYALLAAAFIFLIGAADVSWELLLHDEAG